MEFVRTMDLTSKQRAQLRGLANGIDTILIVGKEGIGDNLVKQANDALEARELIKGRVLENALMSAREAAEALAPLTRSEVVQVIGTKFVLYRQSHPEGQKGQDRAGGGKEERKRTPEGAIKNRIVSEERQQEGLKRKKG